MMTLAKLSFFSIRVFFHRLWRYTRQQVEGGDHFYSSLPLPSGHKHSDSSLQLCMWDYYQVLLIATVEFTRLLDEIYHLIELPFDWLIDWVIDEMFICLLDLILGSCISNLTWETRVFELASTSSLLLQARQLTKCASQPKANQLTKCASPPLKCASHPKGIKGGFKGVLREF